MQSSYISSSAIKFVSECYKTQELCVVKVIDTFPITYQYKTQEISDKAVSEDPFMLKYCHDR